MKTKFLAIMLASFLVPALASTKEIYVSKTTGSKGNPGTKEKPLKFLWKVMNNLAEGDVVHVAEGMYQGKKKAGVMPKITKSKVTLEGGWKADFSARDPFKYLTIIVAAADRQGDTLEVFRAEGPTDITIDGFMIDRGAGCYYSSFGEMGPAGTKAGKAAGYKDNSQWGFRDINRKTSGSDPSIELLGRGSFTVRNNIIINSPWWGIYIKAGGKGDVIVENNMIISSQMNGIEIITGGGWGAPTYKIKNNTVMFNSAFGSTGRIMALDPRKGTGKYIVERNVIAMTDANSAGIKTKFGAKGDMLSINDNLFYLNGRGDFDGVNVDDFEDEVECNEDGKNVHEIPKVLKKMHKGWLERWFINKGLNRKRFSTVKEIDAAYNFAGFTEYKPFTFKVVKSYGDMAGTRSTYKQGRFPHPMKEGEGFTDWENVVIPMVGADGHRGIQKFKK